MKELLFDLGISAILTSLKSAVNNYERKRQIKRVMVKIYRQIGIVFADEIETGEFK
jgi:hypothetical protein